MGSQGEALCIPRVSNDSTSLHQRGNKQEAQAKPARGLAERPKNQPEVPVSIIIVRLSLAGKQYIRCVQDMCMQTQGKTAIGAGAFWDL